jgi:hypothetical protein
MTEDNNAAMRGQSLPRSYVVISTAALTAALVLAAITTIYSYYTSVVAAAPKCAGRELFDGFHISVADIWGLPFGAALVAVMIASLRGEKAKYTLKVYDVPVFKFASTEITYGMAVIYSTVFMAFVFLGIMTAASVERYNAVAKYCLTASAVGPSKVITTIAFTASSRSRQHNRVAAGANIR